jgi:DNA polymerase-3 subunit gamma/tau
LASDLSDYLRQGFLFSVAPELVSVTGNDLRQVEDLSKRMSLAGLVRAMEQIGRLQTTMRDATNPRVLLEVALVRLTHPQVDEDMSALIERVSRLERQSSQPPEPAASPASPAASPAAPAATPVEDAAMSKPTLGALRRQREVATPSSPPAPTEPTAQTAVAVEIEDTEAQTKPETGSAPAEFPSRDAIVEAWGDHLLAKLVPKARARFRVGRFISASDGVAVFALPNEVHRTYCEEVRREVEMQMSRYFSVPVALKLVLDPDLDAADRSSDEPADEPVEAPAPNPAPPRAPRPTPQAQRVPEPAPEPEPDLLDPAVLAAETDPAGAGLSATDRLKAAFPGAEEV